MNILHLSTLDTAGGGGAYDAAYRLHCNMRAAGVNSVMATLRKNSNDETVIGVLERLTTLERLQRTSSSTYQKVMWRYFGMSPYFYIDFPKVVTALRILENISFKPDVIIAHWVSTFITACTLNELSRLTGAPVLWYLLDLGPLTGGCHYSFGCSGFTRQCGNCPQIRVGRGERDVSFRQWSTRRAALQDMDIIPVAGSTWLLDRLAESSIFQGKRGEKILLGMNTDVFCPIDQTEARQRLGLPLERKILFFGASKISEERKGIRYLMEALQKLHGMFDRNSRLCEDILVVTAGNLDSPEELVIPFEHRHIGFLRGDAMLAAAYQAADIYVNSSVEDAGPMMINESLLCGTPVVSFDMGVAPDLVHTGRTGYRARLRDTADMADGMHQLLEMDDASRRAMRSECRLVSERLCHPDVQVKAFIDLCGLHAANKCAIS